MIGAFESPDGEKRQGIRVVLRGLCLYASLLALIALLLTECLGGSCVRKNSLEIDLCK